MIGLRLTVPIACWRRPRARELLETEVLPPPATCYGALLSLVGETERERHVGVRVTAGLLNLPVISTVLRTLWRIKDKAAPQGNGNNAKPDFQQLVVQTELMLWCDSTDEQDGLPTLEARVVQAFGDPASVERFGGWSLGESTHLINDADLIPGGRPPKVCRAFLVDEEGSVTLPIWVDHVGTEGTRYAVGVLKEISESPVRTALPVIDSNAG
jgi:CRISPR-associated protein Cas5t